MRQSLVPSKPSPRPKSGPVNLAILCKRRSQDEALTRPAFGRRCGYRYLARVAALATALSEAVTMLPSMPTPHKVASRSLRIST